MVSAKSYFARMNENRGVASWLTDDQLLRGAEQFLGVNDYFNIEYDRVLDQGSRTFSSPIMASRKLQYDNDDIAETIVSIFSSMVKKYDLSFFGYLESVTFDILDNYELTNPMLVTDSLSYFHIMKNQEISVAIENLMRDGLFILFLNHRFTFALFDKFEDMNKPIPLDE